MPDRETTDRLSFRKLQPAKVQPLTDRENEVAILLHAGKSNDEIAETLGLAPHRMHVRLAILAQKLNLTSKKDLPAYLAQHPPVPRQRIGVHDYASLLDLVTHTFQRLYPKHRPTDPQDMIQYFEAEILAFRRKDDPEP